MSSYQPFAITDFKSGLNNYLQPWIRPQDAFEPSQDAFIYRGVLQRRQGYVPLGRSIPVTSFTIATGDGGTNYSGTVKGVPIQIGSFKVVSGSETFTDNKNGTLTSNLGGVGTINYTTGAWTLNFAVAVALAAPISGTWMILNSRIPYRDFLVTGNGGATYSGTLATKPILAGSFTATNGVETFTDNANGVLTGSAGGTGTINYITGAWALTFNATFIAGVNVYATYSPYLAAPRPIMALKQWTDEATDLTTLIACDTRRAARFDNNTQTFVPLDLMSQTLWVDDGSTATITINTSWAAQAPYTQALVPYTVTISYPSVTMTDLGNGTYAGAGDMTNMTTVNYATGVIVLDLSTNVAGRVYTVTATLQGDYFTGNYSNFFNSTNWLGKLYLTNNKDYITAFDGTNLSRPPFGVTAANVATFTNNIGSCLDVDVYKNRFLVQRPTIINDGTTPSQNGFYPQSIFWSALNNPTNLANDVAGNGSFLTAPTDDFIQSSEFLRDQLIVFFTKTAWTFRFTNSDFNPFRFDKINNTKACNAPYATIPYDERITAIGNKGHIACDGVNVQRYDLPIIDQFSQINQTYFSQCFGQRFDTFNQSWILFPLESSQTTPPFTNALIYNFLENTWATFNLRIPMSCLGTYTVSADVTWNDFAVGTELGTRYPNWASAEIPWDYFLDQDLEPDLLGGGSDGVVYLLYDGDSDNGLPFTCDITSTQWNPFVKEGQKVQFGYIDFYYEVNPGSQVTLTFYTDNSDSPNATRTLTFDSSGRNQTKNMKRIYINAMGEFLQMNIANNTQDNFKIYGMTLWARPAGRMTP